MCSFNICVTLKTSYFTILKESFDCRREIFGKAFETTFLLCWRFYYAGARGKKENHFINPLLINFVQITAALKSFVSFRAALILVIT